MATLTLIAVTASDLISGNNVVYVALFAVGLFFTLMSVLGLGTHTDVDMDTSLDAHADIDLHADADADLDAGIDTHVDADADADVHADLDAHADGETGMDAHGGVGALHSFASFFGVGRAPLSVIVTLFCYTAAIVGAFTNLSLMQRFEPITAFRISLGIALIGASVLTRFVSRLMGRYLPTYFSTAQHRRQFVGLRGEVTMVVGERFGQVFVRDQFGTLNTLKCKTLPSASPIPKGAKVVLTKYIPEEDIYYVSPA
ncbi:MAG TPA: hypothetical protein VGM03_09665 [Phycisphaerae bacterium]|jgi:membrane protein implicated in regulation of membrane protease activity